MDPWCEYELKLLKCDEAHVLVSIKYMKLNNPVTTDDHSIEVTLHNIKSKYQLAVFLF